MVKHIYFLYCTLLLLILYPQYTFSSNNSLEFIKYSVEGKIEVESSYFSYVTTSKGDRYFSYLAGPKVDLEPHGEAYNGQYIFKFGTIKGSFANIDFLSTTENITYSSISLSL